MGWSVPASAIARVNVSHFNVPLIASPDFAFASTVKVPPFAAGSNFTVPLPDICPPRTVLTVAFDLPFTDSENIGAEPSAGFQKVS